MTAPATYQTPQPSSLTPTRPGTTSAGGDGGYDANGVQSFGQQPRRRRYQWQTSHPPAPQGGMAQGSAPPPTFAQMQQNGQARPAPPPQQQPMSSMSAPVHSAGAPSFGGSYGGSYGGSTNGNQLQASVNQALQNPSAYGSPQVQDTFNMLNQSLGQDYDYQRKQLNEELASRGISASTIAGQRYSDLATEQARAQANMATQLANQAALTYGQDRNAAIQSGLGLGNLDLSRQLGMGNLGVAQQNANTQQLGTMGNLGLGQRQLEQQGSQFGQSLGEQSRQFNLQQQLAQQLGLGGLGIQQQQANTQAAAQQAEQAYQSGQLTLAQRDQALKEIANQQQYGLQQGQLDLSRQLGFGNLDLNRQQLQQQGQQFDKSFGLDALKNQQQYGLQQADVTGTYNGQQTLASRAQQMAQQQFQQQLAQQLGLATMSDKTANRGIDVQGQTNLNQLMMQLGMYGIGGYGGFGATGTGGSNGTGGTGGAGGSANYSTDTNPYTQYFQRTAGTDPAKQEAAERQLEQTNPRMYASLMLANTDPNVQKFLDDPNNTVNFGGQTYTGRQYYAMMQQHPEQFGVRRGAATDEWNNNFFANGVKSGGYYDQQNRTSWRPPATPNQQQTYTGPTTGNYKPMQLGAAGTPGGTMYYRDQSGKVVEVPADKAQQLIQQAQTNPFAMIDPDGVGRFFLGQDPSSGATFDMASGRWINGEGVQGKPNYAASGANGPRVSREQFFEDNPDATLQDWLAYTGSL